MVFYHQYMSLFFHAMLKFVSNIKGDNEVVLKINIYIYMESERDIMYTC